MAKQDKEKKGFWKEFKEFISRGNILDMAIGVIIGGAFTAIVTALCDNILRPLINGFLALILGKESLSEIYTFIRTAKLEDGTIDLANSIYIDWGAFINAVINFILIAIVLFVIMKVIMKLSAIKQQAKESIEAAAEKRRAEKEAAQAATIDENAAESAVEAEAPVDEQADEDDKPKEE